MILPKLGLTMEEGTLIEWHVREGGTVQPGDLLCEVETDKLTNEIKSKVSGVVKEILVEEGDTVPVQTVLAVIDCEARL
ncbi:MAG: biotin/lipoyl-binding protein [Clostridia bacterium]|nr:biotin/lipoyl-binding protein [Clostridia bacterium]